MLPDESDTRCIELLAELGVTVMAIFVEVGFVIDRDRHWIEANTGCVPGEAAGVDLAFAKKSSH